MDCNLPGSFVHGIFQARILEWVVISFSWGSSRLRDRTQISCIARRFFMLNPQGFAGAVSFSWMLLIPLSVWHLLLTIQMKFKNCLYYGILLTISLYYISYYLILSCLTLCDHMIYSLPGSFVHGIFQARILEWVAISSSRGSSRLRDRTQISCIAGRLFTIWATREAHLYKFIGNLGSLYLDY